jgi:hypothetical protein
VKINIFFVAAAAVFVVIIARRHLDRKTQNSPSRIKQSTQSISIPSPSAPSASPVALAPMMQAPAAALNAAEVEEMRLISLRHSSGDYRSALDIAEAALRASNRSPAYQEWLNQQLGVLLSSYGWELLQRKQCLDAIPLLRRSDELEPSAQIKKGLGYCYAIQRSPGLAIDYMEAALKGLPNDRDLDYFYIETLENDLQFDKAVQYLQTMQAKYPGEDRLSKMLLSMRAKAAESPKQAVLESNHFRLIFREDDHASIAPLIFDKLEVGLDSILRRFELREPTHLIDVILYPSEFYRNVTPGSPDWASAVFDGKIRIPLTPSIFERRHDDGLRQLLVHELMHAILADLLQNRQIPTWLNEALAQWVECDNPHHCGLKEVPSPGHFLGIEEFKGAFINFEHAKASRAYRQSIYLLYIAARASQLGDDEAIRRIITAMIPPGTIDSDRALSGINLSFAEVYRIASSQWPRL